MLGLGSIDDLLNEQTTSLLSNSGKTNEFNTQLAQLLHNDHSTTTESHNNQRQIYNDSVSEMHDTLLGNGPMNEDDEEKGEIIEATSGDYKKLGILVCIMIFYSSIILGWDTGDHDGRVVEGELGIACVTPCIGSVETRDFFYGHDRFQESDVIELQAYIDPTTSSEDEYLDIFLISYHDGTTGYIEKTIEFGPVDKEERLYFEEQIYASDMKYPSSSHVLNVYSRTNETLTFNLNANVLNEVAKYSVPISATLLVIVYLLILLESIHTSLIAVFGAFNALALLYWMNGDIVMELSSVMMFVEWTTITLLFGMMILVGELSHTGVFEWFAVRILIASQGSFYTLVIMLCCLTAFVSAFLDNVTTMLLVAPVTIDMCSMLFIDPRPYLIAEVLLSNIGGTATLIGDPPNLIIGSAFSEVGFVDFIIHVAPCIFLLIMPISLALICYIYKDYFSITTNGGMNFDAESLKKLYVIYDEPRLLIAGTVTCFVIMLFFLSPVHEKETAFIALVGGFITMAFTNPHNVQGVLRNHVEWDTLLFFGGLFIMVESCAQMGLLDSIADGLSVIIKGVSDEKQMTVAITLIMWVSAITSSILDNVPFVATMTPVIASLADEVDTLDLQTLAWALSFGACLGGNGTMFGASANIVTTGISRSKGYTITFSNFFYPGFTVMIVSVAIANIYMLVRYT